MRVTISAFHVQQGRRSPTTNPVSLALVAVGFEKAYVDGSTVSVLRNNRWEDYELNEPLKLWLLRFLKGQKVGPTWFDLEHDASLCATSTGAR